MKRRRDWPERLAEVVAQRAASAEVYPCAYFVADCVLAMTGEDPLPDRAGADQDYEQMRRGGFESLRQAVGARLAEQPLAQARRGDVVMVERDGGEAIGICLGERCAFADAGGGVAYVPMLDCVAAFSVPFEE